MPFFMGKKKIKEIEASAFQNGKNEANRELRETVDKIEENRGKYVSMTEKELLVETMMALASYGRRIDRIEDNLASLNDINSRMSTIIKQTNVIKNSTEELINKINLFQHTISNYEETQTKLISEIESAKFFINELSETNKNVEQCLTAVRQNIMQLNQSKEDLSQTLIDLERICDKYSNSSVAQLLQLSASINSIEQKTERCLSNSEQIANELKSVKTVIYGEQGTSTKIDQLRNSIESIVEIAEEVKESLTEIDEEVRETNGAINNPLTGMEGIKSSIDKVEDSMEEIKSSIDKVEDSITGYGGVETKLDELESKISNMESSRY